MSPKEFWRRFGVFGPLAIMAVAGAAILAANSCALLGGGKETLLAVGQPAPDFAARDAADKVVHLSDGSGHARVVYFYPKDETPGCTKEACAFRDAWTGYDSAGVWVFGVSRDSEESHRKFRKSHTLPFPLAADEDGKIQEAYGVPSKLPGIAARVTFLVGADGKIAHVWKDVDPGVHAAEVLAEAK